MNRATKLLVIAGPTAGGKSALGLELAERLNGEIISGDSMQLYRGLSSGVAKPDAAEQRRVKHHLIDVFDFSVPVDVYRYLELAELAIDEVSLHGALPVVVGGTGMYLKALLYGLDELPGDAVVRKELDRLYDNESGEAELKRLVLECDPVSYERWEKHRRKLIRALEVFRVSGRRLSELQSGEKRLRCDAKMFILLPEREELKRRIAARTAKMLQDGWIEEAGSAIKAGLLESPTARQALGYDIIGEYLSGRLSYEEMSDRIITKTWQFARRQFTWFRHQHPEGEVISYPLDVDKLCAEIELWRGMK